MSSEYVLSHLCIVLACCLYVSFLSQDTNTHASISLLAEQVSLMRMSQDNSHFRIPPKRMKILYQVPVQALQKSVACFCLLLVELLFLTRKNKQGIVKLPIISRRSPSNGGDFGRRGRKPTLHQIPPFHPELLHRGLCSGCKPSNRE